MQQTQYKRDLLGEGRGVRNWGRDRGRQTEEAKPSGQKKWGREQIEGKLGTKKETESSRNKNKGNREKGLGLEQREGANQSFYPASQSAV